MHPAVLDTDVASLLHRRKLTGPLAARLTGREPLITFVTYGELTKWAEIRHWGARRREELAGWLSGIPVLPGDEAAATIWGRLSAAAITRTRLHQPRLHRSAPDLKCVHHRQRREAVSNRHICRQCRAGFTDVRWPVQRPAGASRPAAREETTAAPR